MDLEDIDRSSDFTKSKMDVTCGSSIIVVAVTGIKICNWGCCTD